MQSMPGLPRRRSSRREVVSTALGFALLFFGFVAALEIRFPYWADREYAARRERLRSCVAEHPERPILAVIGGSRVGTGFVPEVLEPLPDAHGQRVSVVNYSHLGAGPRLNLLQLHRLLRDGPTPRWLVVEIVPAHLCHEVTTLPELALVDVQILRSHWDDPRLLSNPVKCRLTALPRYRDGLLQSIAPAFATGPPIHLDRYGGNPRWLEMSPRATADKADLVREIRWQYRERMACWRVDPQLDSAMRALLHLCRARGIQVALAVFPESTEFRSWYGPGVEAQFRDYVDQLAAEYTLPLHDARDWMPDTAFHDPHHLTPDGAKQFSQRVAERVLRPLVSAGPP